MNKELKSTAVTIDKNRIYNPFIEALLIPSPNIEENDNDDLPERYIINDGATILFWKDGSKTVVKRSANDSFDPVKGFLWAYFQKHCGLSKTKANKYLWEIQDDIELKKWKEMAYVDIHYGDGTFERIKEL